jgi:hypothetical protein
MPFRDATIVKSISNANTSLDVDKPDGTAEGDLVLFVGCMTNAQSSVTGPSGATLLDNPDNPAVDSNSPNTNLYLWIKRAGSSEPGTYNMTWGSSGGGIFAAVTYYDVEDIDTDEVALAVIGDSTTTDRTTPSITTGGDRYIVSVACDQAASDFTGSDVQLIADKRTNAISLYVQGSDDVVAAGSISRTITASVGHKSGAMATIAIAPLANPLAATASVDVDSGAYPLTVTCDIDASGGSGDYEYEYDWGDGHVDTAQSAATKAHTYTGAGGYDLKWKVTD